MELTYRLLDHPFYKAWSCGEITTQQLSGYHQSYRELIREMPVLWSRVTKGLNSHDEVAIKVIADEASHISLWEDWSDRLPKTDSYPEMADLKEFLFGLTPSALLGAIHSFEVQQPEVAQTKMEGLIKYYGFDNSELRYFREHLSEHEHVDYGISLLNEKAEKNEFEIGFRLGSEKFYQALDLFV